VNNFERKPTVASMNQDRVPGHYNSKGLRLDPRVLLTDADKRIDFALLEELSGQSVLSATLFDRRTIAELCKFAALLEVTEIASHHPLDGKLVITAFFEASTRTRLSFESAVLRLDGKIVSVPDGNVTGIAKGESLADIGEMFNTYGDLVVMRHPDTDAVDQVRTHLHLPLVNAGNGSGEHPTQALLDWYTLLKWRPSLGLVEAPAEDRIHLGIIGTPGSMRAVKSFVFMALLFPGSISKITIVSEMVDPLGAALGAAVARSSIPIETTNDVGDVISDLDVIYMNSIAFLGDSYKTLDKRFKLTSESPLKKGCVIMHPFARRDELDTSLDDTAHNLYFAQAASGVFLRQALLICLLGRIPALPPSIFLLTN
jgi:aspartate carbamoyltransferase catalytic subunit